LQVNLKNYLLSNNVTYTEFELVSMLQKQDDKAFKYLYEKYNKALYNAVYQIINDIEISNDVLQQVFVTIWQKMKMYDASKGRLFTWMLNVTRNASIDYLRSKANKNNKRNQELTDNVHISNLQTNEIVNIDAIGIKKFISELKEDYKVILTQSYFLGYTHEEIADNLDIPLGTVKTRLRASLIQLRSKMIEN
jgi:RNA polymerase sigma factor (sigma-70 family)